MLQLSPSLLLLLQLQLFIPTLCETDGAAGYFDAPGAAEAALMVATGQKDTFGNVVMVFCNIDG